MLSGKCSARCIDCIPTSASQQLYGRVILRRHGVMLSGPIDFFIFFIALIYLFIYLFIYLYVMTLPISCNFVYCNRWIAESDSILKFALADFFQCGEAFIFCSDVSTVFRRS